MGLSKYPFTSIHLTPDQIERQADPAKQINEFLRRTIDVTGVKTVPQSPHLEIQQRTEIRFQGPYPAEPFITPVPTITGYTEDQGQYTFHKTMVPHVFPGARQIARLESQPTPIDNRSSATNADTETPPEQAMVAVRNGKQPLNTVVEAMVYRKSLLFFEMLEEKIRDNLSSITDLSPQNLKQLRKLKESLKTFINALDQYLECIDMDQADDDVLAKNIMLKAKNKCLVVYKELRGSKIREHLNLSLDITDDHFICSILGLEFLVAQDLKNLDAEIRCHKTDLYWIHKYMDNAWEDLQNDSSSSALKLTDTLQKLGFNKRKSEFLTKRLNKSDIADHKTVLAWAKEYIDHKFKYDILLNHEVPNYPYNDTLINEVYDIPIEEDDDEDNEDTEQTKLPIKVMGINVGLSETDSLLDKYRELSKNSEDYTYWFHGTDHKSAQDIIENGIDLEKGKSEADFSSGNGFYLTTNIDFAYKWSTQMMKKATCAILVFQVEDPKTFLERFQGIIYEEPRKDWVDTIRYYRSGKDLKYLAKFRQGSKRFGETLRKQQYIIGPISKDGSNVKEDGWIPRPRQNQPPYEMELCIKEFFMAKAFYNNAKNVHQAIFASRACSSKQLEKLRKPK